MSAEPREHLAGTSPLEPEPLEPTRRERRAWVVEILAAIALAAGGLYLVKHGAPPALAAFFGAEPAPARIEYALAACSVPTEHEQLHVIVRERDGRLIAECMHVSGPGTYRRPK